ncbi:MAG: site-2 protease family protein [Candidatus Saccharibacteria bacterium]|nr:site-2 protease family protein [Candidatus Saccharibacteria bacterium]
MFDSNITIMVIAIACILVSMTLHEAMHAYSSYWLGDDTAKLQGRLSLNPLKHIDPILTIAIPALLALSGGPIFGAARPVPFNPFRVKFEEFGAALVGIAGPLTNLVLALAGAGILRLFIGDMSQTVINVFVIFIQVNIGFFVFNMIPFPPLDGSRVFYAVAPEPVQNVMRTIESFGLMGLFLFLFVALPVISPVLSSIMRSITNYLLL